MNIPILYNNSPESNIDTELAALERRKALAQGLTPERQDAINGKVSQIIRDVAEKGDAALLRYTEQFDGVKLSPDTIRVDDRQIREAVNSLPKALGEALHLSAERIRKFQKSILLSDPPPVDNSGRRLALRYLPVEAAGICVPGASASLASSVLMNVVPAAAAGVKRIAIITPPGKDGKVSIDRLAAAAIAGADEIYSVSGAQGVAALAFGTETIRPVDYIAGPGNVFVSTAKKLVFGKTGIDMIAGPSEVVVIADRTAAAERVAAEMLAQSEHTDGSAVLLASCPDLAENTIEELALQGAALPEWNIVRHNLQQYGCVIVCFDIEHCIELSNRLAPEHLVIMCEDSDKAIGMVRHAGAIFEHTPVAVGDYMAGPSHTLPTGTTARFTGGLTANNFLKSSSIISYTSKALNEDAGFIRLLAETEGLPAHALTVRGDSGTNGSDA